jgi:MFS family permease
MRRACKRLSSKQRLSSNHRRCFAGVNLDLFFALDIFALRPLYILSTILMGGYAAIFTLLAQLRSSYGFTEFEIGIITAAAFIAGFFAQISLSRLADLGRGSLLMRLGMVLSILGAGWMCIADSLAAWIFARVLLGFGAGAVRPAMRRLAFVLNPTKAGEMLGRLAAWEMVGFLMGPIIASVLFEIGGLALPFYCLTGVLMMIFPFVLTVHIPGSDSPLRNPMRVLLKRPEMQSCLALGVAFYLAVGAFDAIWALFISDLGASQLYIGVTMSLFTLPMIFVAPYAGRYAARQNLLLLLMKTLGVATVMIISYAFIKSIWWICLPLIIHAVFDAVSMPASQLAVGRASGEEALAAGQGLFGATGLVVAATASLGGGYLYQTAGGLAVWLTIAFAMLLFLAVAYWRGRDLVWSHRPDSDLS